MFAVAAAQGRSGAAIAEALLKQGEKVRALVRTEAQAERWHKRHAEAVTLDLADTAALTKALTGVTGASLTLPPNPKADDVIADRVAFFEKVAAAVKAAKLQRVVFLSCIGAQHPSGTGATVALHRAEALLKSAAPVVTHLRAATFLERWGSQLMSALESGELKSAIPVHQKFLQVGAHDVGDAAARALLDVHKGVKVLELAGREPWSADDVAVAFAGLLERPVKAVAMTPDDAGDLLRAGGASDSAARLEAEWFHAHARGHISFAHPHGYAHGSTALYDALKPLMD
ncbi:MAG: NAD(P)H-binding protein [Myxococcaceae bacterium]|nr:NAD(P)H-binding protein [Myxococcaceae bacterium]